MSFIFGVRMIPGVYRNSYPNATYDLRVLRVQYRDIQRIKIKYVFVTKLTGEDVPMYPENLTLYKKQQLLWSRLPNEKNQPNG